MGQTAESPEQNVAGAVYQTLLALMNQAAFDQDLSCRTVGRCVAGPVLDREVWDLIPRDEAGEALPLTQNLGRAFLYARYDAELTAKGLAALNCPDLDPECVSRLDSVEFMSDLERVGREVAKGVDVNAFGPLLI